MRNEKSLHYVGETTKVEDQSSRPKPIKIKGKKKVLDGLVPTLRNLIEFEVGFIDGGTHNMRLISHWSDGKHKK